MHLVSSLQVGAKEPCTVEKLHLHCPGIDVRAMPGSLGTHGLEEKCSWALNEAHSF